MKLTDFNEAAALTKLSDNGKKMAKLHLVDGLTLEEAGQQVLGPDPLPMRWRAHKAVMSIKKVLADGGANPAPAVTVSRMSAEEFDEIAKRTKLGKPAQAMARRYLVDGMTMDEAGRPCGMDKRRVNQVVQSIRKAFAKGAGRGSATVKSSVDLPAGLVVALQDLGKAIKACPSPSRRDETVNVVTAAVKKAAKDLS